LQVRPAVCWIFILAQSTIITTAIILIELLSLNGASHLSTNPTCCQQFYTTKPKFINSSLGQRSKSAYWHALRMTFHNTLKNEQKIRHGQHACIEMHLKHNSENCTVYWANCQSQYLNKSNYNKFSVAEFK